MQYEHYFELFLRRRRMACMAVNRLKPVSQIKYYRMKIMQLSALCYDLETMLIREFESGRKRIYKLKTTCKRAVQCKAATEVAV